VRILIIKLGAMGDVLRTTPLLRAYKSRFPRCEITWVVNPSSRPILEGNPLIDGLISWGGSVPARLAELNFDLAINLDKEPEALDAIAAVKSREKKGFGWNGDHSDLAPLNAASEYAVRLGKDDELKFRINQKTYQEISFEQVGIPYRREEYVLALSKGERAFAADFFTRLGRTRDGNPMTFVGINTGSGERFAGKSLPEGHIIELSAKIAEGPRRHVLLLGGPEEEEKNVRLESQARRYASNAGTNHSIKRFAAIVEGLGAVVTGDTIAMHVAIAMKVPAVVFFGSTCPNEIELYGKGVKMVSDITCAPCYKRYCPIQEKCMSDMSTDQIQAEVELLLQRHGETIDAT